nr:MAG TPA: hypothetical protein [Caudoviricetes sp.]
MNILRICGKYVELLTLLWNISSKTVTIFADRYRYEKLKFYLHNNFQWKKVHKERCTKQHII